MGGSSNPEYTVRNYNIVVQAAYRKLGLVNPFKWQQKKIFIAARKNEHKELFSKLFV